MPTADKNPVVSVAMGVRYKRSDTTLLERSVRSILAQSFTNFEFLICQQDSTPEAVAMLEQLATEDDRINLIYGAEADSLTKKLNRCISAAQGDYLARMDDDDYALPERLTSQVSFLEQHPGIAFVGCAVKVEQSGKIVGQRRFPERPAVHDFFMTQPYIHPALVFRKAALDTVGGYRLEDDCAGCEDYELLLRLYEAGFTGANLTTPQLIYTIPPKGTTNRSFAMRYNEVRTRYRRFRALGLLPSTLPYVIKPMAAGLIPTALLERWKARRMSR